MSPHTPSTPTAAYPRLPRAPPAPGAPLSAAPTAAGGRRPPPRGRGTPRRRRSAASPASPPPLTAPPTFFSAGGSAARRGRALGAVLSRFISPPLPPLLAGVVSRARRLHLSGLSMRDWERDARLGRSRRAAATSPGLMPPPPPLRTPLPVRIQRPPAAPLGRAAPSAEPGAARSRA